MPDDCFYSIDFIATAFGANFRVFHMDDLLAFINTTLYPNKSISPANQCRKRRKLFVTMPHPRAAKLYLIFLYLSCLYNCSSFCYNLLFRVYSSPSQTIVSHTIVHLIETLIPWLWCAFENQGYRIKANCWHRFDVASVRFLYTHAFADRLSLVLP